MTERSERPDIDAAVRSVAADLERRSRVTTPAAAKARSRSDTVAARWWWRGPMVAGMAAMAAIAVVVAAVVVLVGDDEGRQPVVAGPSPTETTDASTSTTSANDAPDIDRTALSGSAGALAVLEMNGDTLDLLAFDDPFDALRRVGQLPVTDEVLDASTGLLELTFDADGARLTPAVDPAELPTGCASVVGIGGVRVARCGDDLGRPDRLDLYDATGESTPLIGSPTENLAGHWRWIAPAPDGANVLAQWSGECEAPSTWLVDPTDGAIGPVLSGRPHASTIGLAWLPDGRAVVQVLPEGCGLASEPPGVYAVDTVGVRPPELLLPTPEPVSVWLVRAPEEPAEPLVRTFLRAMGEAGLTLASLSTDGIAVDGGLRAPIDWDGATVDLVAVPVIGAFPYVPYGDIAVGDGQTTVGDDLPATVGRGQGGRFVAITCGGNVWYAESADEDVAHAVIDAVLPHLYCTAASAPLAPGHEDLSQEAGQRVQALADGLLEFALHPSEETAAVLPFADEVRLGVGDRIVRTANRDELLDPATWELEGNAFEREGPFSALALLAGSDVAGVSAQLRPFFQCGRDDFPAELYGYESFTIEPADASAERCGEWFGIYVFQHPVTEEIEAVTLVLWEP